MPHVLPHLSFHSATCNAHFVRHPHRVIAQHFVATHQDECGWQAAQFAVKRRGVWVARVCAGEAKFDHTRRQRTIGSKTALSLNDSPVSARSVQGETTTVAAGSSVTSSRSRSRVAKTNPPPAESPIKMM
jgi:hypothetical protein